MSLEKKSVKSTKKKGDPLKPPEEPAKETDKGATGSPRPKRVMSEAQKANLAKGRLKAHERMRSIKADKEELAKYKKQDKPLKSVDSDDDDSEDTPHTPPKEKTKPKKKPVMKSPDVSDEDDSDEEEVKPIVKVSKGKRIIEKHYYHEPPKQIEIKQPPPPPPPPPPAPAPAPVVKTKKKLNFR